MQELRFVAVSEDGSYAVLAVPGRSGRYILPIDERLRAVAQGQTSRLAQYEIEVESPLRPKEIQARIRAGETAEEIADAAGIPVERVRWFEGPVLAERAYIADQAQAGSVRRAGDSAGPGPRLGDIVTARLTASGTDPADGQWDARKRGDGNWQVSLTFPSGGRLHVAEWVFDPRRRHVMPDDDNAARLSLPESELPPEPVSLPGEATVTPIASRLGAAAGMGGAPVSAPGGYAGSSGMSRFRPERSVIPDRSLGGDRSLADRPAAPPAPAPAPALPAAPLPAPDRSGGAERPAASRSERSASHGYADFPESAPYRAPGSAQEPPAYRAPAQEPAAFRPPVEPPAHREPEPGPAPEPYRPPAAPQPGGYREPAPAPRQAPAAVDPPAEEFPLLQAADGAFLDDAEREQATPQRPVVFEDPEPALRGEQLEQTSSGRPAEPAPGPAAPDPSTAPAASVPTAAPGPAAPAAAATSRTEAAAAPAGQARHADTAEHAPQAGVTGADERAAGTQETVAVKPAAPAPAADDAGAAQAPAIEMEIEPAGPAATTGRDATSAPAAASAPATATGARQPAAVSAEAVSAEAVSAEAVSAEAGPAEAGPAEAGPAEAGPAEPAVPTAAAETEADVPASADPPASEDPSARQRPGAKKNPKGRRSSVPSWDEIMLGSSRQRD
jgi:Protein of unknown function (DUF3071)